jgi:hypothetical protein
MRTPLNGSKPTNSLAPKNTIGKGEKIRRKPEPLTL